jgi:predicted dinucleotide-binding enzyme
MHTYSNGANEEASSVVDEVIVQGCVDLLDDGPLDQGTLAEGTQLFVIGWARCSDDGGCANGGGWCW